MKKEIAWASEIPCDVQQCHNAKLKTNLRFGHLKYNETCPKLSLCLLNTVNTYKKTHCEHILLAASSENANGCKDGELPPPTACFHLFCNVDLGINERKWGYVIDRDWNPGIEPLNVKFKGAIGCTANIWENWIKAQSKNNWVSEVPLFKTSNEGRDCLPPWMRKKCKAPYTKKHAPSRTDNESCSILVCVGYPILCLKRQNL